MPPWKQLLLTTYYYATLPWRVRALAGEIREGRAPIVVLFYHRVADFQPNGWTIDPQAFDRQLNWLQRSFDFVSLLEAQRRIREGNRRPAVSITFDDGYADNCLHALPQLVRRRIPCTYFVATRHIGSGQPFPHDVAAGRPLPPNTPEQIQALAEAGVEIGAHTRTHADLGRIHDPRRLEEEVLGSVDDLQSLTGRPVRYFAFPYGLHRNLNLRVFRMAREAGLSGVCSAYGGYNYPGRDAFHLQRIHADPQWARFRNWLTGDPRKRRWEARTPRAEPQAIGAANA